MLDRAELAARDIVQEEDAGPWAEASLVEEIMKRAGVTHAPAVCAEDRLISEDLIYLDNDFSLKRRVVHSDASELS